MDQTPSTSHGAGTDQSAIISKLSKDMSFVGIWCIIGGILYCIPIIYAFVGIPLIFAGIRLRDASAEFTLYLTSGDTGSLNRAFERQGRFFNIIKILIIVSLCLTVLGILAVFLILMFSLSTLDWLDR